MNRICHSPLFIVTDLDGTLLDHDSYSFAAAAPALFQLSKLGIPLVLNSSKTAAEIADIRMELDNHEPYAVENGGGIYAPVQNRDGEEGWKMISFGRGREEILAVLQRLRDELGDCFTGFADMEVAEISAHTGLDPVQSHKAKQRDFTEPLLWHGDSAVWQRFCTLLEREQLSFVKGGRFIHISGGANKGEALNWLRRYYHDRSGGETPLVLALGDSDNDREMLEFADFGVVVRSPVHEPPKVHKGDVMVTRLAGSAGWNEGVLTMLERLGMNIEL